MDESNYLVSVIIPTYQRDEKYLLRAIKSIENQSYKNIEIVTIGANLRLSKLAFKTPIFTDVDNKRSMIYIDNLSEFVKRLIDNQSAGLFSPQNSEYVNISGMVRLIAEVHGKKIMMTKLCNPLLKILNIRLVNKVFGDLVYDFSISANQNSYNVYGFKESIRKVEVGS